MGSFAQLVVVDVVVVVVVVVVVDVVVVVVVVALVVYRSIPHMFICILQLTAIAVSLTQLGV